MNLMNGLKGRLKGFIETIIRFPLSIIFLAAAVIINAININNININANADEPYTKLLVTFLLGAAVYAVGQLFYERFFNKLILRLAIMAVAVVSSFVYYMLINHAKRNIELTLRTGVIFFIFLNAFIWVPVIKNRINYNQSFTVVFKGFFTSAFFTGILYLGVVLILSATNKLIVPINGHSYEHAANIIFILLAPIYFLSLIPVYPKSKVKQDYDQEYLELKLTPTKFLEALVSSIVIPITALFTIILLLYIVMNITGDFWTDNLMEPLLISYSITVIIVYLLACNMNTAFTRYFRRIFPKVLVPVVLLQTISSVLRVRELGITYERYYVILFGVFAVITGILFCILPIRKNGIIAPILIALSVISIVPPVDAFTAGRVSQTIRLENALKRNHMLEGETIIPNSKVTEKDQKIIKSSVSYLNAYAYTKDIGWLSSYYQSGNFDNTFGFAEYGMGKDNYLSINVTRNESTPIPVNGYDFMIYRSIGNQGIDFKGTSFEQDGNKYQIRMDNPFILLEKDSQEILRFDINDIFNKFSKSNGNLPTSEATFTQDSAVATLTVIVQNANINEWENGKNQYADVYILVGIK